MPIDLTPRELYIDAHPMILWELLRAAGRGQLPGSRNRARLVEDRGDSALVEFISVAGNDEYVTLEELTFHPPARVTYEHRSGPLRSAHEEFVLHPTENGGVILAYRGYFEPPATSDPSVVKGTFDALVLEHMEELKQAAEARAMRSQVYPRPTVQ